MIRHEDNKLIYKNMETKKKEQCSLRASQKIKMHIEYSQPSKSPQKLSNILKAVFFIKKYL